MLHKVISRILKKFQSSYQHEMDQYISSKQPQNAGDIERLMREYEMKQSKGNFA
jgi:hypothetical protein